MSDVSMAHCRSYLNRQELLEGDECSCYFCIRSFKVAEITDWADEGQTAKCPHCDVDSLIPGRWSEADLRAMHERWFTGRVSAEECAAITAAALKP